MLSGTYFDRNTFPKLLLVTKTTMTAMRATDGKCEHVCADPVLMGELHKQLGSAWGILSE